MRRNPLNSRAPLVAALGGLLMLGPFAGRAQDKPQAPIGIAPVPPPRIVESESFDRDQPYPWPAFLGVEPRPGRYISRLKVEEFSMAEMPELDDTNVEALMRDSMASEQTFCIRGGEPPEDWAREIGGDACDPMALERDGDGFSMHMSCRPEAQVVVDVAANGEVGPDRSRMTIAISGIGPGLGDLRMVFHSQTERLGDCG